MNQEQQDGSDESRSFRDGLMAGFRVKEWELKILARHHFYHLNELEWHMYALGGSADSNDVLARCTHSIRLAEIAEELGESQFQDAIGDLRSAWEKLWQVFNKMDPCETCGNVAECVPGACEHQLRELSPLRERTDKAGHVETIPF
jgi:hypothetical protein